MFYRYKDDLAQGSSRTRKHTVQGGGDNEPQLGHIREGAGDLRSEEKYGGQEVSDLERDTRGELENKTEPRKIINKNRNPPPPQNKTNPSSAAEAGRGTSYFRISIINVHIIPTAATL